MIYILEDEEYEDSQIQYVLEGPARPSFENLVTEFDQALGLSPRPVLQICGVGDWQAILAENKVKLEAWEREQNRIVSGRFGGTTSAPNRKAYWEAVIQWLCETHDYRKCEYEVWPTNR